MSALRTTPVKRVLLAAPRGYCAGVDRAVVTVEKALELYGPPVYVRKEIVHNKHVVTTLRKRGAVFVDETMETVRRLRERFPKLQDPPSDDICYATQNRQLAVKQMARDCDLVVVVGSRNSSNSVRLVEVALEHGARAAHLVDYADEIEDGWLDGVSTVGVTSGASVPEVLVRDVLAHLAEHGFGEAETVVAAEESLLFALPTELRRDLKARSGDEPDQVRHDPSSLSAGVLR